MAAKKGSGYPWRWVRRLVLWNCLPYAALAAFYLLVFRLQAQRLNNAVRIFNKRILNPVMVALDRCHWYVAVLRHNGRRSGREYATPVTAQPTEDGFVIPLSYGEGVDWFKNVRVAGRCTIESRDGTHTVVAPKVIDRAEALGAVSPRARAMFRLFGIKRYVKVRRFPETPREATGPEESHWGTAGLVDTSSTPTLLTLVSEGRLDPTPFATHPFELSEIMDAMMCSPTLQTQTR